LPALVTRHKVRAQIYEEHPGAPRPPGEPETSNITLNPWTPRLQTLGGYRALSRARVHRIVSWRRL